MVLAVAVAGALGAPARYLVERAISIRLRSSIDMTYSIALIAQ